MSTPAGEEVDGTAVPPALATPLLHDAVGGMGGGVVWTYVSVAVTTATYLFLVSFVFRLLGPARYGTYALITAVAMLVLVVDFGLGLGVIRATARRESSAEESVRRLAEDDVHTAHSVYLLIGAGIAAAAALGAPVFWLLGGRRETAAAAFLLFCAAAVNLGFSAFQGLVTGSRRFDLLCAAAVLSALVNTGLTVLLLARWGLVGLGVAQLAAAVGTQLVLLRWIRREVGWFRPRWQRPAAGQLRRTVGLAGPLVFISAGSQIINTANLALIGAVASPAAVGLFRLASAIPTQGVAILYRGYDVVFPSLVGVADERQQERVNALLTRVVGYVAGVGFGVLLVTRERVVALLSGAASPTAARVLGLFCLIWLVNVPAHGICLLVIARSQQQRLVSLTLVEAAVSLVLTVVLSYRYGAVGAAVSALLSIVVSNAVVLPLLVGRALRSSVQRTVFFDGYARVFAGLGTAALAGLLVRAVDGNLTVLVLTGLVALAVGAPVGALVIGRAGRALVLAAVRRRVAPR